MLCAIPKNDDLVSDELGTRRSLGAGIDLDGIDATGSASQRDVIAAALGRESVGSHAAAVDPIDIDHKGVDRSRVEPQLYPIAHGPYRHALGLTLRHIGDGCKAEQAQQSGIDIYLAIAIIVVGIVE